MGIHETADRPADGVSGHHGGGLFPVGTGAFNPFHMGTGVGFALVFITITNLRAVAGRGIGGGAFGDDLGEQHECFHLRPAARFHGAVITPPQQHGEKQTGEHDDKAQQGFQNTCAGGG